MPRVKKSTIPGAGKGLFARRDYKKGEFVTEYGGYLVEKSKVEESNSDYLFRDHWGYTWDSEKVKDQLREKGRWINDDFKDGNVFWVSREKGRPPKIYTRRKIKKGEEFFINYGDEYWKDV